MMKINSFYLKYILIIKNEINPLSKKFEEALMKPIKGKFRKCHNFNYFYIALKIYSIIHSMNQTLLHYMLL